MHDRTPAVRPDAGGITPGVRVAYSRAFLRACAMHTGEEPFLRGCVASIEPFGQRTLARVLWDGHASTIAILAVNLVREDRLHLEPV